jgi:flagella basal body P-ring formation protein FlgA
VTGPVVRVGDVFAGAGDKADLRLGGSPAPGDTVELSARWLARAARHYDLDWHPTAASATTVTRAATLIGQERIAEAVQAELRARGAPRRLSVDLDQSGVEVVLPAGADATVEVLTLARDRRSGRFETRVAAGEGAYRETLRLSGRAVELVDVPVTARRIPRGEVIGERDLAWIEIPKSDVRRGDITAPEEIVGMAARRALRADDTLRASDLEPPVLVERNALVTIRVRLPRMSLSAKGRALADGAEGEVVRVLNTASKTTVSGVVMPDGSVAVQLAAATN